LGEGAFLCSKGGQIRWDVISIEKKKRRESGGREGGRRPLEVLSTCGPSTFVGRFTVKCIRRARKERPKEKRTRRPGYGVKRDTANATSWWIRARIRSGNVKKRLCKIGNFRELSIRGENGYSPKRNSGFSAVNQPAMLSRGRSDGFVLVVSFPPGVDQEALESMEGQRGTRLGTRSYHINTLRGDVKKL